MKTLALNVVLASLSLAGCAPEAGDRTRARAMSITELDGALDGGPQLVEVKVAPGTLDATELHVDADDDEKITSAVASLDAVSGTITLELGGLVLGYGDGTRFRTPSASDVARGDWEAAIAAGTVIEARRSLPAAPQDPEDPGFTAEDLRIADDPEDEEPSIELLVGSANLAVVSSAPVDAILHVLGLDIAVGSSTELWDDDGGISGGGDDGDEVEAAVVSVDVPGGTLTLAGGTVVDVSGATFDPEGDLLTLQATADAVAAGAPVRAEADGTMTAPGQFSATSIEVEVDD